MTAPGGRLTRPIFSPTETPGADSDQRACAPLEHAHNTPLATNQADELQPLSATGPPIRHVQHTDAQMDTGSGPPYGSTDSVTIQDLHLVIQQQQAQMQAMQVAMQERPTRPPTITIAARLERISEAYDRPRWRVVRGDDQGTNKAQR